MEVNVLDIADDSDDGIDIDDGRIPPQLLDRLWWWLLLVSLPIFLSVKLLSSISEEVASIIHSLAESTVCHAWFIHDDDVVEVDEFTSSAITSGETAVGKDEAALRCWNEPSQDGLFVLSASASNIVGEVWMATTFRELVLLLLSSSL